MEYANFFLNIHEISLYFLLYPPIPLLLFLMCITTWGLTFTPPVGLGEELHNKIS